MVREITLRQEDGGVTAALPQEMADRLKVKPGDKVYAVETERGVLLTIDDPESDDAHRAFEEIRKEYRNTLKRLGE